jgi:hypothetical protein
MNRYMEKVIRRFCLNGIGISNGIVCFITLTVLGFGQKHIPLIMEIIKYAGLIIFIGCLLLSKFYDPEPDENNDDYTPAEETLKHCKKILFMSGTGFFVSIATIVIMTVLGFVLKPFPRSLNIPVYMCSMIWPDCIFIFLLYKPVKEEAEYWASSSIMRTKRTHKELIEKAKKWLMKPHANCTEYGHTACTVIISELVTSTAYGEIPDIIGYMSGKQKTVLIECKTSYSDFIADQKKPFRNPLLPESGMGDQRWYFAEKGIIPLEKVPEKWGLLEIAEDGKIKTAKKCELFKTKNYRNEINILLSAMCRLKVTHPDECTGIRFYHDSGTAGNRKKASLTINAGYGNDQQDIH